MLSTMAHANVLAIIARRISGVPVRLVALAPTTLSLWPQYRSALKDNVFPLLARGFYRWADSIVAVSHGVRSDLIESRVASREQVRVIYDPVITPEIFSKAQESIDHPWFAQNEVPIILGVGRLTKVKDYPTLIQAFERIRAEHPAKLVILGEGEERYSLETLIQELGVGEDISLPGFVDNPFKYLARASVFVLSSRLEGLPNALIQALAIGTPVVSTDCASGPREILDSGRYGILVPVGDVNRLAEAVIESIQKDRVDIPVTWRRQFELHHITAKYLDILGFSGEDED